MTKKDYELIAGVFNGIIRSAKTHVSRKQEAVEIAEATSTVNLLADAFAKDNPRFDRARFIKACGIND